VRRKSYFSLTAILCVAVVYSCGYDREERWQQYIEAGTKEYGQRHFAEAESLFAAALNEADHFPENDPRLDTTLGKLAQTHMTLDKYDQAQQLHERILQMREQSLGPDHLDVGRTVYTLGILCDRQDMLDEAESYYKRSLAIFEKHLGPEDEHVYHCLRRLAWVYRVTWSYDDAVSLYRRAIAMREKLDWPNDTELIRDIRLLAETHVFQMKHQLAEPLYKRVLRMLEEALGADHPQVAVALDQYAFLLVEMGRQKEADKLIARAQSIRNKQ